jgi:hypothetical protein
VVNFCKLIHHKETGRSCGYGFVYMYDAASDQRVQDYAVQHRNRVTIQKKPECYLQRNDQRRVKPVRNMHLRDKGNRNTALMATPPMKMSGAFSGHDPGFYNHQTGSGPGPDPGAYGNASSYNYQTGSGPDPGAYGNAPAAYSSYQADSGPNPGAYANYQTDSSSFPAQQYNNNNPSQPVMGQMHSQTPPQGYAGAPYQCTGYS